MREWPAWWTGAYVEELLQWLALGVLYGGWWVERRRRRRVPDVRTTGWGDPR